MARRRWDARPWLHIPDHVQMKMLGEIGKGVVVGHNLLALVRLHRSIPLLLGSSKTLIEVLKAFLKVGRIGWIKLSQFPRNATRNSPPIIRIQPIMRIPKWMNISHRARYLSLWYVENLRKLRSIEITRRADLNPGISALVDERRQPADLQLQSDHDQQIRIPQPQQKARLRLDEMWILISLGNRFDRDLISTHLLRQRRHIGRSGNDRQFLRLCRVRQ